ncbi:hypothetical protein [Pyrobaculum sp.]|uniref:hypothetical protein n=1 Tax=Pyrobaculum sp. TaxID=2004705 RepID=UPI00317FD2C3
MRLVILLLFALFVFSLSPAPGIGVEIANKTTFTFVTDIIVRITVNNTELSLRHGADVYTVAVVHLGFHCDARIEKTFHYVMQNPTGKADLSIAQLASDVCPSQDTYIDVLNATFVIITRGGRVVDVYYLDISPLVKGVKITPEWRALAFTAKTEVVDRCSWVQTRLVARGGGDIGLLKITSWDCFNQSKAVRIAYMPYYHYLAKYVKVRAVLTIDNATITKDLTNGTELIVPDSVALYGEVKYFKIEIVGPQNVYTIYPLNYTGPISIRPLPLEQKAISAVVVATRFTDLGVEVDLSLNDIVSRDGLRIETPPGQWAFVKVNKPNYLTILLTSEKGAVGGNFTIIYKGPGVVKRGNVTVPILQITPPPLAIQYPLAMPKYYPVQITQPQLLLSVSIPRIEGQVAAYVEINITLTPREWYKPVLLIPAAYFNKSGVLTPNPYLTNASNSGIISATPNGTVRLKYLIPTPPGRYDNLVLFIYGDNVASYKVEQGRTWVYTLPPTSSEGGSASPMWTIGSVAIASALLAYRIVRNHDEN